MNICMWWQCDWRQRYRSQNNRKFQHQADIPFIRSCCYNEVWSFSDQKRYSNINTHSTCSQQLIHDQIRFRRNDVTGVFKIRIPILKSVQYEKTFLKVVVGIGLTIICYLAKILKKRYILHWFRYRNSDFEHPSASKNGTRSAKRACCFTQNIEKSQYIISVSKNGTRTTKWYAYRRYSLQTGSMSNISTKGETGLLWLYMYL